MWCEFWYSWHPQGAQIRNLFFSDIFQNDAATHDLADDLGNLKLSWPKPLLRRLFTAYEIFNVKSICDNGILWFNDCLHTISAHFTFNNLGKNHSM
jgi:hypothetical protein